uniref:Pentatricopeptide repeat-containing protein n=1 Tax=Kalanchoe fedtschenkoi TaxID=63787 RepID=A0A7N0SX91_KALFE
MDLSSCLNLPKLPPFGKNPPPRNVAKHWDAVIKQQAKLKSDEAILSTYREMEVLGLLPDQTTLPLVLKACARLNAIEKGRKIHKGVSGTHLIENVRVGTALVDFYCKCGLVEEARDLFDEMCNRDVVSWNAMVSGYVGMGCYEKAMELGLEMGRVGLRANSGTVVALLVAAGELERFGTGRELHGYCLRNGLVDGDVWVGTGLVGFYAKSDASAASSVFESFILKNTVSWNVMLRGYFDAGKYLETVNLFESMLVEGIGFDGKTMLVVVQACGELGSLKLGMQIHQLSIKSEFMNDVYVVNALINMYSKNGSFECVSRLFEGVAAPDAALWNSKISSTIEHGCYEKAMSLFAEMRIEGNNVDARTVVIMLSMCVELDSGLRVGRSLHALVVKSGIRVDAAVGNALLSMYAEMNHIDGVKAVFNQIESEDVISWNSYILALARNELALEAWEQFERMQTVREIRPNSHTVITVLSTCAGTEFLNAGRLLHGFVIKHGYEMNPSLSTALTDMYMDCGDEAAARKLFEDCSEKDLVSWNAMIAGYIRNNQAHKALLIFDRMKTEMEPNSVTLLNLLSVCTDLANLQTGQCLHAHLLRWECFLDSNVAMANALITMYARCGYMKSAESLFRNQSIRDVISWNAIIAGYGSHGLTDEAMRSFTSMLEDGFKPTGVTFISLLSACSHSGLVELGLDLFHSMVHDFNIAPELNHYGCVVDLLGRSGRLHEARDFINAMPVSPDASIWRALLSACRNHPDINFAKSIFDKLMELEPTNAGNYVLLANIYAAAGHWPEVEQLWNFLKDKNLAKEPGISWISVKGQVHSFTAGDETHPKIN